MAEILKQTQPKTIWKSEHGKRRVGMMFFSILLMGFGISVFSFSGMGVDPFTALNMSVSAKIGVSFGFWQMLVNAVLLLIVARFSKKLINLGTVINMVGVGYVCDFFTALYARFLPEPTSLPVRLGLMLCGVVLLSLSASLFFTASLGVGPYDAVGFVLRDIHIKKVSILIYIGNQRIKLLNGQLLNRCATDRNSSIICIPITCQQFCDCRFAAS